MRVPINWLKEYVNIPAIDRLTEKLSMAGHLLDKTESIGDNLVIDLELRGNRADCYSILGIAREVSALFDTPVKYPKIHTPLKRVSQLPYIKNTIKSKYVTRAMMVGITDVKITKSPDWLKNRLEMYGITPINNIVDLTNYVMIETGEPMHAFDLDVLGNSLEIRLAKNKEKLITFLGDEVTTTTDDLVWANKEGVLSIAGAIGGKTHSISPNTKNILLEAANYDRANIRRSIHKHNLLTEAGIRHEKDLDPNLVDFAIYRFLEILQTEKWGNIGKSVYDYYPNPIKPWGIEVDLDYVRSLSGIDITKVEAKKILKRLNFKTYDKGKNIIVEVPTIRTDVVCEEDVIEEILRIKGYEKINESLLALDIPDEITPDYLIQEFEYKKSLVALGFDEIISIPFVKQKYSKLNRTLGGDLVKEVSVLNKISPDIQKLRLSMLPNLYESGVRVINEHGSRVRSFEIGKVYFNKKGVYTEKRKLGMIYWEEKITFANFKRLVEGLFEKLNIDIDFKPSNDLPEYFTDSFEMYSNGNLIAIGGKYEIFYFAEIDLDSSLPISNQSKVKLWPKFPPQIEDITFSVPERTYIGEVIKETKKIKYITHVSVFDSYKNYLTLRIWYQKSDKTLNDSEVKAIRTKLIKVLERKFGLLVKD